MLRHWTIFIALSAFPAIMLLLVACTSGSLNPPTRTVVQNQITMARTANETTVVNPMPVVHVFVALADNEHQGIVPVSASLGNGDNPATNLYWGAAFGVKAFFTKSKDWELVTSIQNPSPVILERSVFKHRRQNLFLIADAYRGREISQATWDFLAAAAGQPGYAVDVRQRRGPQGGNPLGVVDKKPITIHSGGSADQLAYIGHDGLMDFKMPSAAERRDKRERQAIILACASKQYFKKVLERTGAKPLLWTTNLMAPEAYILSAALEGWIKHESDEQIRMRAAAAYNKYQNCGLKAASNLFATGW